MGIILCPWRIMCVSSMPAQYPCGAVERFEVQHRSSDAIDRTMVLLDHVIEAFDLTDDDRLCTVCLDRIEGGLIGSALVDGHLFRPPLIPLSLIEKALRCR